MKKRFLSRMSAALCALTLLAALTPALAAEGSPETVRAAAWDGSHIYVEDTPICFADETGRAQTPLVYNGSVYIPLQTASEWLGASFTWNPAQNTVTLTRTGEPYYRDTFKEGIRATDEDLEQMSADLKNGVAMELRPDMKVLLDGKVWSFSNVSGAATPPALFRGVVFLPIRGVAEGMDFGVFYLPKIPQPAGYSEKWHELSSIRDPDAVGGEAARLVLFSKPTQDQLDAVQRFLDSATALFYDGLVHDVVEFFSYDDLSDEKTLAYLHQIEGYIGKFAALAPPDAPFFRPDAEAVRSGVASIRHYATGDAITILENESGLFDHLEYHYAQVTAEPAIFTQVLNDMRFRLARAQRTLDAVLAAMELQP